MKSNYLFRALSDSEEELLNCNELQIKPDNPDFEQIFNESDENTLRGFAQCHVRRKNSGNKLDSCISLTSSIATAIYCANYTSRYHNIIAIDIRDLDQNRLFDMSTCTHYYSGKSSDANDNRRDGLYNKYKEYDYFGTIHKFIILPKWLCEYICKIKHNTASLENVCAIELNNIKTKFFKENPSVYELYINYLGGFLNIRDIPDFEKTFEDIKNLGKYMELSNELSKLLYLYENDNYSNLDELYNKNLYLYLDSEKKLSESHQQLEAIRPYLSYFLDYLDEYSETLKVRNDIENILDIFKTTNFVINPELIFDSFLERFFYNEYFKKNRTMTDILDLFIEIDFLNILPYNSNIIMVKCSILIFVEYLRCLVLNRINNYFKMNKRMLSKSYILTYFSNKQKLYRFVENSASHLTLSNINTKGFNKNNCIIEHLEFKNNMYKKIEYKFPIDVNGNNIPQLDKTIEILHFIDEKFNIEIDWIKLEKYYNLNCL